MKPLRPFERIYFVVSQIPKGKVSTYGAVTKAASIENPRVVGFALHANSQPEHIPCHRIVKKNGSLAKGYAFGGPAEQKRKLVGEGVSFLNETTVDLKSFLTELVPYDFPRKSRTVGQARFHL